MLNILLNPIDRESGEVALYLLRIRITGLMFVIKTRYTVCASGVLTVSIHPGVPPVVDLAIAEWHLSVH